MKRIICTLLSLAVLTPAALLFTACSSEGDGKTGTEAGTAEPEKTVTEQADELFASGIDSTEKLAELKALVWREYAEKVAKESPERATELKKNAITKIKINRVEMKVQTKTIGRAPENGYPVFLVYHGGGYDPTNSMNESQWSGMATRYTATSVPGIYISIRSISDNESSGQIFSTDASWKYYDRIIEDAILYLNADPDKVYIVGYSAGGNGVYQIAPTMADSLAAATMTAGHPEGISLSSLYNLPFYLNAAELDSAYSRNTITVEYSAKLDALSATFGGGYEHYCFIHYNTEHGAIGDNAIGQQTVIKDITAWYNARKNGTAYTGGTERKTTDAATLMTSHTRNPLPEKIVWDISTSRTAARKCSSFYWLDANGATSGTIVASYDKASNTVKIEKCPTRGVDKLTIYLSEDMVDIFNDVTVDFLGKKTTYTPEISLETLRATTQDRGDPGYQFAASITINP